MTESPPLAPLPARGAPVPAGSVRPGGVTPPPDDLLEQSRKLQQLVQQAEELRDPVARALVHECLQTLLSFYGDGLSRVLQVIQSCGPEGQRVLDRLLNDPAVRALLLIHGLHPLDLPTRLHQAIEKIRPYMESHGGNVELLSLENDVARLRLQGACKTCPASSVTLELALRAAIEEACPDLMGFEVEGAQHSDGNTTSSPASPASPGRRGWTSLEGLPEFDEGEARALDAAGVPLVLSRLNGNLYAYRNACPACALPLETGRLEHGQLHCPKGHHYAVQQAGRDMDSSDLHLAPIPLLVEEGIVKVALG